MKQIFRMDLDCPLKSWMFCLACFLTGKLQVVVLECHVLRWYNLRYLRSWVLKVVLASFFSFQKVTPKNQKTETNPKKKPKNLRGLRLHFFPQKPSLSSIGPSERRTNVAGAWVSKGDCDEEHSMAFQTRAFQLYGKLLKVILF